MDTDWTGQWSVGWGVGQTYQRPPLVKLPVAHTKSTLTLTANTANGSAAASCRFQFSRFH